MGGKANRVWLPRAERDRREGKNKGKDKGGREEARQNFERIEPATDYSYGNS